MFYAVFFLLIGVVVAVIWIFNTIIGAERWCERCNKWSNMKLRWSKFACQSCGFENEKHGGCPNCGWYGKYSNRFVGRVGPYSEMQDFGSYLTVYRETWSCPKHGNFTMTIPASQSSNVSNSDYDQDNDFDYWYDEEPYQY